MEEAEFRAIVNLRALFGWTRFNEKIDGVPQILRREMSIDRGHLEVGVSEEFTDDVEITPTHGQKGGERVAASVAGVKSNPNSAFLLYRDWVDAFLDTRDGFQQGIGRFVGHLDARRAKACAEFAAQLCRLFFVFVDQRLVLGDQLVIVFFGRVKWIVPVDYDRRFARPRR